MAQTVRDWMTPDPRYATAEASVTEVARMMLEEDCGLIPVVDNENDRKLVGVVTDRDIVVRLVAREIPLETAALTEAMSADVVTMLQDADLANCAAVMARYQVRRIPIVDEQRVLVGMLSQADLARASDEKPGLEDDLAETVQEVSRRAA